MNVDNRATVYLLLGLIALLIVVCSWLAHLLGRERATTERLR